MHPPQTDPAHPLEQHNRATPPGNPTRLPKARSVPLDTAAPLARPQHPRRDLAPPAGPGAAPPHPPTPPPGPSRNPSRTRARSHSKHAPTQSPATSTHTPQNVAWPLRTPPQIILPDTPTPLCAAQSRVGKSPQKISPTPPRAPLRDSLSPRLKDWPCAPQVSKKEAPKKHGHAPGKDAPGMPLGPGTCEAKGELMCQACDQAGK